VKRITVPEHGRIPRSAIDGRLLRRLQSADERLSSESGGPVFDWDHVHYVAATNYVGVVQVPGLTVEILPKIDTATEDTGRPFEPGDARQVKAQANLLYMLSFARKLPARPRDLAQLRLQRLPLLEAMIAIFAGRLVAELRKGVDHGYVHFEENGAYLRGKLLVSQQVRHNAAHRERFFTAFDEFVPDTWLNRILKAACWKLTGSATATSTQQLLREALLCFVDVEKHVIRPDHFQRVHLHRNTERFSSLLDFARLVLTDAAPAPSPGKLGTFSLLFPMETLFEEFIAGFLCRYAREFGLQRGQIHAQAARRRRWLLRTPEGAPRFRLKPDIVIDDDSGQVRLVLDTKWKRLRTDAEDSRNGVSQADLYQLYAYAHRYDSADNVLLYPRVEGVSPKTYYLEGEGDRKLRVAFVDLNRDLQRDRRAFSGELRQIVLGHAEKAAAPGAVSSA